MSCIVRMKNLQNPIGFATITHVGEHHDAEAIPQAVLPCREGGTQANYKTI
jgi:hypothetical protein